MPDTPSARQDFLSQVNTIIEQNLANEEFGVTELADILNMSRSNLLRKVKKESKLSVSQLINHIRLKKAMELLRKTSFNVSEVAHQVGFNSTSYFIKCFREYYGYPPGEVGKRPEGEPLPPTPPRQNRVLILVIVLATAMALGALLYFTNTWPFQRSPSVDKSIAVLPFKNESNDSTNVYFINGLMESTLNNLQKIKDLRVISRTSSEKFRNSPLSIPEMARDLQVHYFVEGSGQKIGDQILLTIQLIDATNDRHIWSAQYKREVQDIFQLQQEIAKSIAEEVKAVITPKEETRIRKRPTKNLTAYDLFLKGKDFQAMSGQMNQEQAIAFFAKAIEHDREFALAYAETAITYYFMDAFRVDKQYTNELNLFADKAFLYDSKLGESLVAKALTYMNRKEYKSALPYLEKALEYHPNSASVIGLLSDFYGIYIPNTARYLEYALQGMQLDIASMDSSTASYTYLRLANALIQNGFVDESLRFVDQSLVYNPQNPYSHYVRAFILFAQTQDARQTRELLLKEFNKDTTRLDILQDIGKVSYYMRDYAGALTYYQKFLAIRESRKLDIYRHENLTIALVLAKAGMHEKSQVLAADYKTFMERDPSIYRNLGLSAYHVYQGDHAKAIEHVKLFSKEDNVQYWIILFLEKDPLMESIKNHPEFKQYFNDVKVRFWKSHKSLKQVLDSKGLLASHR
jgi:TolB-like protein/AraC-like DNA-binding protein/Tfp pilus assembly protein PilF